jgi:hypothetical protein
LLFTDTKAQAARAGSKLIKAYRAACACRPVRKWQTIVCAIIFTIPFLSSAGYASQPGLHADQEISTAGYYQLSWTRDDAVADAYMLEETDEGAGSTSIIYEGVDTATVISGKPDGVYHYTLRTVDGSSIGKPVTITVKHHPLATAFNFFLVGAIVFIFILVAIIRGNRTQATQR